MYAHTLRVCGHVRSYIACVRTRAAVDIPEAYVDIHDLAHISMHVETITDIIHIVMTAIFY